MSGAAVAAIAAATAAMTVVNMASEEWRKAYVKSWDGLTQAPILETGPPKAPKLKDSDDG